MQISVSDSLNSLVETWTTDRVTYPVGDPIVTEQSITADNCYFDHLWRPVEYPYFHPRISSTLLVSSAWRFSEHKKSCELSRDLPGVKVSDLQLMYNDGAINLTARRFDTGQILTDRYVLNEKYDPDTVQAALDFGVLTIRIRRFPGKGPKQITVSGK